MVSLFALTERQWLGVLGMVIGLLLLFNFRRIANLFAAIDRAEADVVERVTPKRAREVVSIWARAGTGDDIPSKAYRYGMIVLLGLIGFFAGLAALLGAWAVPE